MFCSRGLAVSPVQVYGLSWAYDVTLASVSSSEWDDVVFDHTAPALLVDGLTETKMLPWLLKVNIGRRPMAPALPLELLLYFCNREASPRERD